MTVLFQVGQRGPDKSITSKKRIDMLIRYHQSNLHHVNPFQGVQKWNIGIKQVKLHSKVLYLNFQEKCLLTVSRKIAKIELIIFGSRFEMTSQVLLCSRSGMSARIIYVMKSATNHCTKQTPYFVQAIVAKFSLLI